MKWFKKHQHCLFVEDEIYNWAPPRNKGSRRLLIISVLILSTVVVLILL